MNIDKTKVMIGKNEINISIKIDGRNVELIETFKYLDIMMVNMKQKLTIDYKMQRNCAMQ